MKDIYLEITFRKGKALAAYLYLSKKADAQSLITKKIKEGIIIDFNKDNKVIGLEITAPNKITINEINKILNKYHAQTISEQEFAPLKAA
jgi:uncharacterized protein YuzE